MEQKTLTDAVRRYYDNARDDRNLLLARQGGLVNHHFGIGDATLSAGQEGDEELTHILNVLELNQIDMLFCAMGDIRASHRVLDAGCGRGGTSMSLNTRFGTRVDGITISGYQADFANALASEKGLSPSVEFHEMNYLNLTFPASTFDHVITSESTQYAVNLAPLFEGFARALKPGGRYTIATWCLDDAVETSERAERVNKHYGTTMHRISEYTGALSQAGFTRVMQLDATEMAIPYFQIRKHWSESSGIEQDFVDGFTDREFLYFYLTGRIDEGVAEQRSAAYK